MPSIHEYEQVDSHILEYGHESVCDHEFNVCHLPPSLTVACAQIKLNYGSGLANPYVS